MKTFLFPVICLLFMGCSVPMYVTTETSEPQPITDSYPEGVVETNYQVFYDQLGPYGNWVEYPDYGYVWHPNVNADFRPYATNGHWLYSDEGWTWVSNYNWGWAPFHYGTWFYDDSLGWLWVPGHDWAPAWVTWGRSGDYYCWAPLAPHADADRWTPPQRSWNFVPSKRITRPDLDHYVVNNDFTNHQRVTIINNISNVNNYKGDRRGGRGNDRDGNNTIPVGVNTNNGRGGSDNNRGNNNPPNNNGNNPNRGNDNGRNNNNPPPNNNPNNNATNGNNGRNNNPPPNNNPGNNPNNNGNNGRNNNPSPNNNPGNNPNNNGNSGRNNNPPPNNNPGNNPSNNGDNGRANNNPANNNPNNNGNNGRNNNNPANNPNNNVQPVNGRPNNPNAPSYDGNNPNNNRPNAARPASTIAVPDNNGYRPPVNNNNAGNAQQQPSKYNRGPAVNQVENATNDRVPQRTIQAKNQPGPPTVTNTTVTVFKPQVQPDKQNPNGQRPAPKQVQPYKKPADQ